MNKFVANAHIILKDDNTIMYYAYKKFNDKIIFEERTEYEKNYEGLKDATERRQMFFEKLENEYKRSMGYSRETCYSCVNE